jgi:hypothetical protein
MTDEEFIKRMTAGSRNLPPISNESERIRRLAQESARARKERVTPCVDPEPAPKPVRTAEDERADVVAYLRDHDGESYDFADDFELGVHVGYAKKEKR